MKEKRRCSECEELEADEKCRELVEWLGAEIAEKCACFKALPQSMVEELLLEAWR